MFHHHHHHQVFLNLTEVFLTLTEVFPCFFLSCKANARVKLAKTGNGPHSSALVCICVARLLFVLFYVLFVCKCVLPPGENPIAVNKCIISYYHCHYHHHHHHHLALQPSVDFRLLSQVSPSSSILSCLLPVFDFQLF